jgi:prepilin-type N-terminal cleavage/methylation domain-containing protein
MATRLQRTSASRAGVTLIELMVVVAVISILAYTAVAFTGKYVARRQVESLAFALVQDLRNTQASAVFMRSYLAVTFDVPNQRYLVESTPGGTPVIHEFNTANGYASSVLGAAFTGDCVFFTTAVKSTSSAPASVTFYYSPRGIPVTAKNETAVIDAGTGGKGGLVALASRAGGRIDVRVSPVVGQASMEWQ